MVLRPGRRRFLLASFTLLIIFSAILLSYASKASPHVRDRVVLALEERFGADAELDTIQVSVFPRPEIVGTGLLLRHQGRTDVPAMIRIGSYAATGGLWGVLRPPLRLKTVELESLHISIPPGAVKAASNAKSSAAPGESAAAATSASPSISSRLVIERLVTRNARLEIVPRNRGRLPWVFDIHDLVMRGLGDGTGTTFEAALTNPKPRGEIETHGTIGPWNTDDPEQTPLKGEYVFERANLNTIKGIAGTLSSTGQYSGILERIEVSGETRTPDFSVDVAARPVALNTRFQAVVDGTNGDTWLERVEARLGETLLIARGAVVRAKDVKGRHTSLNVTVEDGRVEDLLKLAVKAPKPLMTGRMRVNAKFFLPAGEADVMDKLELTGTFRLDQARFSNINVQERVNTLSQRGKGSSENGGPNVVSRLSGSFTLKRGTLTFSDLSFGVPGAVVQIAGTFDLKRELLDFRGHLLLDASLAETTTGWKAVLARVAQPFFRRAGGGSKLPIRISGPSDKPDIGLDVRRALGPG